MTEQADRTARNVLDLNVARRQLAAVHTLAWPDHGEPVTCVSLTDLRAALATTEIEPQPCEWCGETEACAPTCPDANGDA